jgi:hypothetical protein
MKRTSKGVYVQVKLLLAAKFNDKEQLLSELLSQEDWRYND